MDFITKIHIQPNVKENRNRWFNITLTNFPFQLSINHFIDIESLLSDEIIEQLEKIGEDIPMFFNDIEGTIKYIGLTKNRDNIFEQYVFISADDYKLKNDYSVVDDKLYLRNSSHDEYELYKI